MRAGGEDTVLVISGGVTRPNFPSEADVAASFVPDDLLERVFLEREAETTRQNVRFTKALLADVPIDSIRIVGSRGHIKRAHYLFQKIWPEVLPGLSCEPTGRRNVGSDIAHEILRIPMVIDPEEKIFLPVRKVLIKCGFR